ncbi:MAG: TetR/AcrR family transcriptional regulator [Phycisphaerae bacterium]|nr:TetR/AcrR family transcriptional regulator [Saprospiraceae bacterium]
MKMKLRKSPLDNLVFRRTIKTNVRSGAKNMVEESKGERTRQAILDAMYSLIIEQGYAATSMRQIAQRAGLALGGIYNHFPSKDDIFSNLILDRHPFFEILPVLNSVEADSIETYVRTAAQLMVEEMGQHPDFINLLLTEIVEFKGQHIPQVFNKIVPMVLPLGQRIANLSGTTRNIPPLVMMRAFMGMFFSYYITGVLLGPSMPPAMQTEQTLDHFVEIFLHGILVEKENGL